MGRDRWDSHSPTLQPLDPRRERRGRGIDLGCRGLHQHQLELDLSLGPVGGGLERLGDEVEQSHRIGAAERLGLLRQPAIAVGSDAELGRDLAQDLHRKQLPRVDLQVTEHLPRITPGVGELGRCAKRLRWVASDDRLDRSEQLLGVGDAQHGEHVGRLDRPAGGVGDQLLERPQGVPEAARGVPGNERQRRLLDIDLLF